MYTEKRNFFRLKFDNYLIGKMAVTIIGDKVVNTEKSNILIENIGPGGLKIMSDLTLPVEQDVVFSIETKILGEEVEVLGNIVWQKKLPQGINEYGIKMITDEPSRDILVKLLMKLAARLRQGNFSYEDGSFTEDFYQFFKDNKKQV